MKRLTIAILAAAALVVAAAAAVAASIVGSRTPNDRPERIYVAENTTWATLCNDLGASRNLRLMARLAGRGKNVRPGSYIVGAHMRNLDLVRKLRNGQQDPIRLTVGKYRLPAQADQYLGTKLMHSGFGIDSSNFHLLRPDTYEVYWTISPEAFRQRMAREYDRFWQGRDTSACGLTRREVIILASIVEEETNHNPEKPLVASVYLNRLRRGMPLQADPTVKYALGDFGLRRILNQHLTAESPYNTYLHTGLPPSPICLPSVSSVDAVLRAEPTGYLYFCASDDMDGTHRFAATLAQHNRNAAAFHAALNRRGIK